ncbi:unnamed protein product [Lactuca virosa]|uniref:LOB domain-containing protein n=1 Tax=Lactuca virosa TaxID=75947 RepID=A0AAU9MUT6_9ASTR|nr:unnamed protein product [Lactuca virosa]
MTLKGATTQACAACKYQRKRCTPDCTLAPHFRPEHPLVFKNAHKLFGVKNILRILQQIQPHHKTEAMRSIIYEANMRDQFPVYGCLTAIYDLQYQIRQAEEELHDVLALLAFCKQCHQKQHATNLSHVVSHDSLQLGMNVVQPDNAPLTYCRHTAALAHEIIHDNEEMFPVFDNIENCSHT